MNAAALAWLASPEGASLLRHADALPPDRLMRITRLRRICAPEIASAAVALLELRRRARGRFALADRMWFTPEGLEQSTGEAIARYRASRFPPGAPVLDACCGIGGDAMALARRGRVLAVDLNPAVAICARFNTRLDPSPESDDAAVLCADVTRLDLARLRHQGFRCGLFDPSRRHDAADGGRRRARDSEDYTPSLSWLESLQGYLPGIAVKVSPAIDDAALARCDGRVEFLSDRGECKEAVLWCGSLADSLTAARPAADDAPPRYHATLLSPDRAPVTLSPFDCDLPEVASPRAWLYEPDPAVIRAHLVPQVAALLNAALLDPNIAYLTADCAAPTPFATAYRVLDSLPYQPKLVQERLRALGARLVAVKKRGVSYEPEDVLKRLKDAGDRPVILVLTRHSGKTLALICDPPLK